MQDNKKVNRRLKSTKKYLDELQKQYSKLNIIRLDLYYDKQASKEITLDDASKDFNQMLNNRRNNSMFDNQVGYICKKEYGEDKGIHLHTVLIFNGQKVHKDKLKAKQIGEYWSSKITKGKGAYHNCNMNNYKDIGVGMIDYKNTEKREILDEKVISYLCKDTQSVDELKSNSKDRAFVRGAMPKQKQKAGRPRLSK